MYEWDPDGANCSWDHIFAVIDFITLPDRKDRGIK